MTLKASQYASINEAVAAAVSQGRDLFIDPGDHNAVEPVRYPTVGSNLKVWGAGNASRVIPRFTHGDIFHFGREGSGEIQNLLFEDFAIVPPAEGRIGWAMRLDRCVRTSVNNVDFGNPETARHDNALWFNGYDDSRVDDCNFYARWRGILVNGQPDQGYGADLVIGGGVKIQNHKQPDLSDHVPGAVGLHLAGGQGGTYVDTAQMIFCGTGILIDAGIGVMNREVLLNPGTVVDSCADDGIRAMAGSFGTLQATGVWSASHGRAGGNGCGMRVQPNQTGIATLQVTGGRYFNNREDGIALNGGMAFLSGPVCNANGGYGLHVANSAVRGAVDPLFAAMAPNGRGPVRNIATGFKVGSVY